MRSHHLYLEERRTAVFERIQNTGRASVAELAGEFGVSEVTIRQDLQALADQKLIVRTHGGAVPVINGTSDLNLALRRRQQIAEKQRIGACAADHVNNGEAIFLDSSSTALTIAYHLKQHHQLTIVTNSISIAQEMLNAPGVTVVLTGGIMRRDTASVIGLDSLEFLAQFNIQRGFFGAYGLTIEHGLTDISADEAEIKRPLAQMCREVVAVIDSTKLGKVGPISFAPISEINKLITDCAASEDFLQTVQTAGIKTTLA